MESGAPAPPFRTPRLLIAILSSAVIGSNSQTLNGFVHFFTISLFSYWSHYSPVRWKTAEEQEPRRWDRQNENDTNNCILLFFPP